MAPRVATLVILATSFAVPQARADQYPAPLRSLEDAVETTTEDVLLPSNQPGTLTFRNCAEPCKLRALQVTAQSAFFVGDTAVSLADFNAYLRSAGPQSLMVFHQLDQPTVLRVRVPGQWNPAQKQLGKSAPARKQ